MGNTAASNQHDIRGADLPAPTPGESLIASLTRLQRGEPGAPPPSGTLALVESVSTLRTANVVRELRSTSLGRSLGPVDSAMLEIVALLFDQIFACEEIPPRMKQLIGRLQIPILKVAILDNSFLSVTTHPARKLLDSLGAIAVSLDADLDESSPLYGQIETIVEQLVEGFHDGMDIFGRLHAELEGFVAWQNQAAEEHGKLVAKRVECRERLALAKAVAQQEIQRRANAGPIPQVVLRFLVEHWLKVMLVAHAKHGDESRAWNKAVATVDLLIWSVRPKHSPIERRTLAAVLPKLLRRLNIGMRDLEIEEDECNRFFAELMRCHTEAMNPLPPKPAVASGLTAKPRLAAPAAVPDPDERLEAMLAELFGPAPASTSAVAHIPQLHGPAAKRDHDNSEPMASPLAFRALTMRNPFGKGEVQIEEISLDDLSAGGKALPGRYYASMTSDRFSQLAGNLREGAWVDFRDGNDRRRARLFYVSPLRRTYLFMNAQTGSVTEYSIDKLAREFRAGRARIVESRSLFDQAMGGIISAHRSRAAVH